jgi:hypothetical protein
VDSEPNGLVCCTGGSPDRTSRRPPRDERDESGAASRVLALGVALGAVVVAVDLAVLASRGAEAPPLSDAVIERLAAQGVDPDLVYTVELPGYELAEQSVGVVGGEGFQAIYFSPEGRQVELTVDRGRFDDDMCSEAPIPNTDPPTTPTTCQRDGAGWYRAGGHRHKYVAMRDDRTPPHVLPTQRSGATAAHRSAPHVRALGSR